MIGALTLLLICQLAGETIARGFALPLPGPVLGLVFLAIGLWFDSRRRNAAPDDIERTDLGRLASGLLANLGLLFVPAGVGIVQQMQVIGENGAAIGLALLGSTLMTLLVTVGIFRLVKRATPASGDEAP